MNYFFEIKNKKDGEKAKRTLEKLGFAVPETLGCHLSYFAVGGQVYGLENSERHKPMVDYLKSHSDMTELVLDAVPQFKKGQILVNKNTNKTVVVAGFIEGCKAYICTEYIGCGALTFPIEDEAEWVYVDELPKFQAGQSIQKDGDVFDISIVDMNEHHYLCKTHDENRFIYIIPFREQDEYTLAPIFSVGQKVQHKETNGYYVEITEVLADSYNVVDSDGIPNSFPIEEQYNWGLIPQPIPYKVGDPVIFNGGLYRVLDINKRVSRRKAKRGENVLTLAGGLKVGENLVRKATKEDIENMLNNG